MIIERATSLMNDYRHDSTKTVQTVDYDIGRR